MIAVIEMFLTFIGFPAIAAAVSKGSGGAKVIWFIVTAGISLLAVVIGNLPVLLVVGIVLCIIAGSIGGRQNSGADKKCPFCAELIKKEATICRFCGKPQSTAM